MGKNKNQSEKSSTPEAHKKSKNVDKGVEIPKPTSSPPPATTGKRGIIAKAISRVKSKGSKKNKNPPLEGKKNPVQVTDVINEMKGVDTHWYLKLKLPKWLQHSPMTTVEYMAEKEKISVGISKLPTNTPGFTVPMNGTYPPALGFALFCDAIGIKTSNSGEILKLTAKYTSEDHFGYDVLEAFGSCSTEPITAIDSVYTAFIALLNTKKSLRGVLREITLLRFQKEVKIPSEVVDLDKEVNEIRVVLKDFHTMHRSKADVLRKQLKAVQDDYETEKKKITSVSAFLEKYTECKSGTVTPAKVETALRKYHNSADLTSRYTAEQFLSVFRTKYGAANVERELLPFRAHKGFKHGRKMVKDPSLLGLLPSNPGGEEGSVNEQSGDEDEIDDVMGDM